MESNRYKPYLSSNNGSKVYIVPKITAIIGSVLDNESAEALRPYVDDVVIGNSPQAPAELVLEIFDNLYGGTFLCRSEVDADYIRDIATRTRRVVIVAQHEGKIEAFAVLFEGRNHIEITIICSGRSAVKRAAAALIKVIALYAKALGKKEVYLEALPARKSYYEQFGFVQSGSEDGEIPMTADIDTLLENVMVGGKKARKTRRSRRHWRRGRTYRR